jgi:hypothetical protein
VNEMSSESVPNGISVLKVRSTSKNKEECKRTNNRIFVCKNKRKERKRRGKVSIAAATFDQPRPLEMKIKKPEVDIKVDSECTKKEEDG